MATGRLRSLRLSVSSGQGPDLELGAMKTGNFMKSCTSSSKGQEPAGSATKGCLNYVNFQHRVEAHVKSQNHSLLLADWNFKQPSPTQTRRPCFTGTTACGYYLALALSPRYLLQVFAPFLRLDRFFSFYAPCMKKGEFWPLA